MGSDLKSIKRRGTVLVLLVLSAGLSHYRASFSEAHLLVARVPSISLQALPVDAGKDLPS